MSIFPKRWQGRLIPEPPKEYFKDGKIYNTRTNIEVVQQERSYSEEEVFILLAKMADTIFRVPKRFTNSREWFKQFKKEIK